MKKIKSVVLSGSLIFLITAAAIRRYYIIISGNMSVELPVILTYIIWMIYESGISLQDYENESSISDKGTREIYAAGQALTILSAIWFLPVLNHFTISHAAGIIFFTLGILLRVWAIRTLGIYYSHLVRTIEDHIVIDGGPYSFIRHPAYGGMILAHFGILLCFFNYITLIIFIIIFIPSIILRITTEEKTLLSIPGYKKYAEKRKRIIPGIW